MTAPKDDPDDLRAFRSKIDGGTTVFWIDDAVLGLFDAEQAQEASLQNFADMTLPDRLVDLLRRRTSPPVSWKQVRAVWLNQLHELSGPAGLRDLSERMASFLDRNLNQELDLGWLAQRMTVRTLIPVVISGIPAADTATIEHDLLLRIGKMMPDGHPGARRPAPVTSTLAQIRSGMVVRREIRRRAAGRRPSRADLTDPIALKLLPDLGLDRAVDAVATVLSALSGNPGASAGAVLYAMSVYPEWTARLENELATLPPQRLYDNPIHAAPLTHRFVKEVLRMWPSPVLLTRPVRTPISLPTASLSPGMNYLVSSHLIHHDRALWTDPDTFDPDRWLPDAPNGPQVGSHYIPFGWAPKACVGAGLGTLLLIILCHLFHTRYRVELHDPHAIRIATGAVPIPLGFAGRVVSAQVSSAR